MTIEEKIKKITVLMNKMDITNISTLEVGSRTSICDYFIIGSMIANKQANALVEALRENFKHDGVFRVEGENTDWIIVDLGDIVIHIMTVTAREFYNLEEIWQ